MCALCAECSTLTFTNCNNCSDVSPATAKSQCYSCDAGYTLREDNATCVSAYLWLFVVVGGTFNQVCL